MNETQFIADLDELLDNTRQTLLALRGDHGYWEGELSSSALSTATAVMALEDYLKFTAHERSPEERQGAAATDRPRIGLARRDATRGWRLGRHSAQHRQHQHDCAGVGCVCTVGDALWRNSSPCCRMAETNRRFPRTKAVCRSNRTPVRERSHLFSTDSDNAGSSRPPGSKRRSLASRPATCPLNWPLARISGSRD